MQGCRFSKTLSIIEQYNKIIKEETVQLNNTFQADRHLEKGIHENIITKDNMGRSAPQNDNNN
jgi:hypothetical protein